MIARRVRLLAAVLVVGLCGAGCRDKAPEATRVEGAEPATGEPKADEKEEEKARKKKDPPVPRVSRPDERFHMTLTGPAFSGPTRFVLDPDAVRINVITTRSAIQYVRQGNTPTKALDGSQIVVSQIQWGGATAGEYEHDDKRRFVITLGVEDPQGKSTTLQLQEGKLTADKVSMRPKELVGHFEGVLHATNKGRESEVYQISGAFDLAE